MRHTNDLQHTRPSASQARLGRMWSAGIIGGCLWAMALLAASWSLAGLTAAAAPPLLPPSMAGAAGTQPVVGLDRPPSPEAAPRMFLSHAKAAYAAAERLVHKAGVVTDPLEPVWVREAAGVRITLRWMGRNMGVGDAVQDWPVDPQLVLDLNTLAEMAARRALASAKSELAVMSGGKPLALKFEDLCRRLDVEAQFAALPEPIVLGPSAEAAAVYARFTPGFHGLVMQRPAVGQERSAPVSWTWPGTVLASNAGPTGQLYELLKNQGMDLTKDLDKTMARVARPGGLRLWRFEVFHLIRPPVDPAVTALERGNVIIKPGGINAATLDELTDRISQHLERRQQRTGQFQGTYLPTADRHEADASALDTAMAAYALGRRARHLESLGAHGPSALPTPAASELRARLFTSRDAARRAVDWLVAEQVTGGLTRKAEPGTLALTLLAMLDTPGLLERKSDRDALVKQLLSLTGEGGLVRQSSEPKAAAAPLPAQGLAAFALAAVFERSGDREAGAAVQDLLATLWAKTPKAQLHDLMPWLALAEIRLRGAREDTPENRVKWEDTLARLQAAAEDLRRRQIKPHRDLRPADVVGGFRDPQSPPDGPPYADWQTAPGLAFLAVVTAQAPPRDAHQRAALGLDCTLAARFLAQLAFDEVSTHYFAGRNDALGGIRLALWDNRLALGPSALSLLALTELQQTLRILSAQDAPAAK